MVVLFWILLALVLFSLGGYGLLWVVLARLFGRRVEPEQEKPLRATVLIAARNEEAAIRAKLETVLAQDTGPHEVDILVVSDGSDDNTLSEALSLDSPRVRAFQTAEHGGKAQALNAGLAQVDADVVIFSDANSMLEPGALRALLAPFAEPGVGGACGRPEPEKARREGWMAKAERVFWHYDSALKRAESALGGAVSAQGTLYALRRAFVPDEVPAAMADDFYISVQAPAQHHRLVFAEGAIAREEVTAKTGAEFMRRVRSTERGWRGLMAMRRLMNPARYGLYAVQLFCHKALRRLVAFLLPVLFVVNAAILGQGGFYVLTFLAQLAVYGVGLAAITTKAGGRIPGSGLCAFFVLGHAAMAYGILRAGAGIESSRWVPARETLK